jgi:hypothetical protein
VQAAGIARGSFERRDPSVAKKVSTSLGVPTLSSRNRNRAGLGVATLWIPWTTAGQSSGSAQYGIRLASRRFLNQKKKNLLLFGLLQFFLPISQKILCFILNNVGTNKKWTDLIWHREKAVTPNACPKMSSATIQIIRFLSSKNFPSSTPFDTRYQDSRFEA